MAGHQEKLEQIEKSQQALKDSIEATKRLAEQAQSLVDATRREPGTGPRR